MGRKGFIAASAVALVVVVATGYLVSAALAAPKPSAPTITFTPTNPTVTTPPVKTASAQFTFTDTAGLTFKCSLDGASFTACTSPKSYSNLAQGGHTFSVQAFSGTTASNATSYPWSIVPPAPTILTGPTSPTSASTAKFTFSDAQAGVSFKCSRDGGAFGTCASGVTYSGIGDGSHTFSVSAAAGSATSAATSRAWTVDRTGPSVSVAFPASGHSYNASAWNAGCSGGAGICGTATDPSGVSSVRVGVLSLKTLRYWNGTTFGSTGQFLLTAVGTTSWRLPLPVPPVGTYAVLVSATDVLGNVRQVAQILTFSINSTTAPATSIAAFSGSGQDAMISTAFTGRFVALVTDASSHPVQGVTVTFTAPSSSGPSGSFAGGVTTAVTGVDGKATSAAFTANANPGSYTVTATAPGVSGAANFALINDVSFPINGNAPQPFYPGLTQSLDLTIHNPYNFPITVTSVTVTVQNATTMGNTANPNPNCSATTPVANMVALPYTVTGTVRLQAGDTKTLSAAGATSLPQVQMPNLVNVNQDGCKNTGFHFTYSGTATTP